MAYTATDLTNIETAISAILARLASGSRELVSLSMGDKSISYEPSLKTLEILNDLRREAAVEVGIAAGTFAHRTYARNGGSGS